MKTCPVCALIMEDTYLFCPDDGSSLRAVSGTLGNYDSASPAEGDSEIDSMVVLYCPKCAAEYPLTFSECPTHGMKLTRHNISRLTNRPSSPVAEPMLNQPAETNPNPAPAFEPGEKEKYEPARAAEAAIVESAAGFNYQNPVSFVQEFDPEPDYSSPSIEAREQGFERPGFRVAAIATVITLAAFALVGTYAFLRSVTRRPSTQVARIAEAAPLPFVPTPQEALDYKEEEPPPPVAPKVQEPPPDRTVEQSNHDASSTAVRSAANKPVDKSGARLPVESRSEPSKSLAKVSMSMPALPRGNSGGFDARLIRVRSNKTASGMRYDLTFSMQEQAGRSAQWQRVLVTTRSASGVNHSQAIPFAHRLGAAGALTFTISVELAGRSQTDWQGRVVCTTLGWDNQGAPLQASFGANLTP